MVEGRDPMDRDIQLIRYCFGSRQDRPPVKHKAHRILGQSLGLLELCKRSKAHPKLRFDFLAMEGRVHGSTFVDAQYQQTAFVVV
jgi:hypothetical protein